MCLKLILVLQKFPYTMKHVVCQPGFLSFLLKFTCCVVSTRRDLEIYIELFRQNIEFQGIVTSQLAFT